MSNDRPSSENFQHKIFNRHQFRDIDKKNELLLRKKYQLYAESSDAETNNNTLRAVNHENRNHKYRDTSLPVTRRSNLPDSAKLYDLNVTKHHRRTNSDSSKDKRAGSYVHVKGKRKAPEPPKNPRTLSPNLGRKKRPAPQPPKKLFRDFVQKEVAEASSSSTSLLEDKEIRALIEGDSSVFSQNFSTLSAPSIPSDMERKSYVSPYLKIREDRKLTDEQKRHLIDQVAKNVRQNENSLRIDLSQDSARSTPDVFTIERGQLVYQGKESPKLPSKDEKPPAPSSPISPRPWFKRQSGSHQKESHSILKTLEKRKHKNDEKDLPEFNYSRNSFFGSASRFNIFARISEDSKKKERDPEKRKSQIGMPNISELDREAAEIIQMSQELNKTLKDLNSNELMMLRSQINSAKEAAQNTDEERPKSTKDLIERFNVESAHLNRITVNTAFINRREFFGETFTTEIKVKENLDDAESEKRESMQQKSKLPQLIKETNGIRKQNDLMGLWTCPFCTLENPNWKIICEACEKIKPYEKRFKVNSDVLNSKIPSPNALRKETVEQPNVWDKKTESVLKYFSPPIPNALSKSSSETAIVKSMKNNSPCRNSKIAGSPQMNARRNFLKSSLETQESGNKIVAIQEEIADRDGLQFHNIDDVIVRKPPQVFGPLEKPVKRLNINRGPNEFDTKALIKNSGSDEMKNKNGEVRDESTISQVIASTSNPIEENKEFVIKFENSPNPSDKKANLETPLKFDTNIRNLPKKNTPDLNEIRSARLAKFNLLTNFKENYSIDENSNGIRKKSPEKKFPDKLDFSDPVALEHEKERLREKIRAMNAKAFSEKYPVLKKLSENVELASEAIAPPLTPACTADPTKLGAIRKIFKNEVRLECLEKEKSDEKILNNESCSGKAPKKLVSSTAQTSIKRVEKDESKICQAGEVPLTVSELTKFDKNFVKNSPKLTVKQQVEVDEISDQLKSKNGIETFKATLKSNKTNTLAINRILRDLENAISDGRYDEAGQFAIELAKMKVSLSVTRQKDLTKSEMEFDTKKIKVNLSVKDGVRDIAKIVMSLSPSTTVNDLKKRIHENYKVPVKVQKVLINKKFIENSHRILDDFVLNGAVDVIVFDKTPKEQKSLFTNINVQQDSESDDESQNEKVGNIKGAAGGLQTKMKIEEDGWECPLCTLINKPDNLGCLACSTSRPTSYILPSRFQDIEYKLKVNEDLRTFFDMDGIEKVEKRPPSQKKNDLNRQSVNRKSSDILNILGDEKLEAAVDPLVVSNPNITKNKYRGVDNFNPNTFVAQYFNNMRKPVITSVIYKSSSPIFTKEVTKTNQSHYQELVSLDSSNIAPNIERFECPICFLEIEIKAGAMLRECLHSFCKPCLASHIKFCEEAEIKCPFMDNQYSCQSLLQEREIRALVTKEEYDKHLTRSIRLAEHKIENTYHCKTPNCRGWCIFEDVSNIFKCPVCTIINCLTCGVSLLCCKKVNPKLKSSIPQAVHDGLNCKQFQDQLNNDADSECAKQTKQLLQDLIDKEEALNCPTCHVRMPFQIS